MNNFNINVESTIDYYPFGQEMPGRVNYASSYRMGFNGQWKDSEFTGTNGCHYEFKFREYDSRIGRFWSVDPLFKDYPWNSSYAFAENRVIDGIDLEGKEYKEAGKPASTDFTKEYNGAQDNTPYSSVDHYTKKNSNNLQLTPSNSLLPNGGINIDKVKVNLNNNFSNVSTKISLAGSLANIGARFSKGLGVNLNGKSMNYYSNLDFHGNGSTRLAGGFSKQSILITNRISTFIDISDIVINAIDAAFSYDKSISFSANANGNTPFSSKLSNTSKSVIGITVSTINPIIGAGYGLLQSVYDSPEMQLEKAKIRIETDKKLGRWQIYSGPTYIGPSKN